MPTADLSEVHSTRDSSSVGNPRDQQPASSRCIPGFRQRVSNRNCFRSRCRCPRLTLLALGFLRGPTLTLRIRDTLARLRAQHSRLPGFRRSFPGFTLSCARRTGAGKQGANLGKPRNLRIDLGKNGFNRHSLEHNSVNSDLPSSSREFRKLSKVMYPVTPVFRHFVPYMPSAGHRMPFSSLPALK